MKTRLLSFVFAVTAIFTFVSCDKEMIYDVYPVVMKVTVVNNGGVDLLNPENDGAFDETQIKVLYKDEEYECGEDMSELRTKAYMPHFYGLRNLYNVYSQVYELEFGEFDGAESYSGEEITILWGDGTSDNIKFNRTFKWKNNGKPKVKHEWFLNGKKVSDETIDVIKIIK